MSELSGGSSDSTRRWWKARACLKCRGTGRTPDFVVPQPAASAKAEMDAKAGSGGKGATSRVPGDGRDRSGKSSKKRKKGRSPEAQQPPQ